MKVNFLKIAVIALMLIGCNNSKFKGYEKTDTGLYYKVYRGNSVKPLPVEGDVLTVNMTYYLCVDDREDSLIFSTDSVRGPIMIPIQKPIYQGDIAEGLVMVTEDDSISLIVKADSFMMHNVRAQELPAFVNSETMFRFEIKVLNHKTAKEYNEEMKIIMEQEKEMLEELKAQELIDREEWLKNNNIKVKPTESGLFFVQKEVGTGPKVEVGNLVHVHYTGYFLDGQVFDSSIENEPFTFIAGKGDVIAGWDEAVLMMRKGGKSRIILPSEIAYGESKPNFPIPPYSTLYFDVEVVDVEKSDTKK